MKPVFTSSLLSLRNAGRCCATTLKIRWPVPKKGHPCSHTIAWLHGYFNILRVNSMSSIRLDCRFQTKWFTTCQCKPVAMLHLPCVSPFVILSQCACYHALDCFGIFAKYVASCWLPMYAHARLKKHMCCTLLLFKGCFAKAYLRRDNDFGVTFLRSSPTSPFLPRCTNLCGCKRINRDTWWMSPLVLYRAFHKNIGFMKW